MQHGPERLETRRLVLRRPQASDAAAIFTRYASDAEATRWLGWPRHESLVHTERFLSFSESQWQSWPAGPYLIEARASGALLGTSGFTFVEHGWAETGYVLARAAWGQGFATEAFSALLELCAPLGIHRVIAECHHEHRASQRVLEKCRFLPVAGPTQLRVFPNLGGTAHPVLCYHRTW